MFSKLRAAYALLVDALTDHAGSVREADRRFRSFYGLEAPAEAPALPEAPTAPPETGDTPETEPARGNGRTRKRS